MSNVFSPSGGAVHRAYSKTKAKYSRRFFASGNVRSKPDSDVKRDVTSPFVNVTEFVQALAKSKQIVFLCCFDFIFIQEIILNVAFEMKNK